MLVKGITHFKIQNDSMWLDQWLEKAVQFFKRKLNKLYEQKRYEKNEVKRICKVPR